jgi:hypothetical protein
MTVTPFPAVLAAARRYATEMDWRVFPAPPGKKKSYKSKRSSGWRWGATKNLTELGRDFEKWPRANVGIPTGIDNRIIVVECDTARGHARLAQRGIDGIAALKKLEEEHRPLPTTLMAESPSGSIHYYFKHPGGHIQGGASKIADGVDVMADGQMVIAPPSVRKDGTYRWANWGTKIADPPAWLIDLILAESERGKPNPFEAYGAAARIDELEAAMAVIPKDRNWDDWNKIGMALWRATGGSDEGFELFDRWSAKNEEQYDEETVRKRWQAYFGSPPSRIGAGTIFYLADQASPDWRRDYEIALWKKFCTRSLAR